MDAERYAEKAIGEAVARGEFSDVEGAGSRLPLLSHDPDWWIRALVHREQLPDRHKEFSGHCSIRLVAAIEADTLEGARTILAESRPRSVGGTPRRPQPSTWRSGRRSGC